MSFERWIAEQLMKKILKFRPKMADCYSLICEFYRMRYEIDLPKYEYSSVRQEAPPDKAWRHWHEVSGQEARPGDVVLIYGDTGIHAGILLDHGDFVHCQCIGGPPVVIQSLEAIPKDTRVEFLRHRHAHC